MGGVQQSIGAQVTQYLLDTQPGLWQVLASTTGGDTTRSVHGPTGIQQQQNPDSAWVYPAQDALGSVRSVADANMAVLESREYEPYGEPWGLTGTPQTDFGFTGQPTDENDLVYLRARHYSPALGAFPSPDPLEGEISRVTSFNGYGWVEGNVANRVDPSGMRPLPLDRTCGIPHELATAPCPSRRGEHPLVMGDPVADRWLQDLGFCNGATKSSDLDHIMSRITATYGFSLPQRTTDINAPEFEEPISFTPWSWDNLASVGRGAFLVARAIELQYGLLGEEQVRQAFGHATVTTTSWGHFLGVGGVIASVAILVGGAAGVVPPVGIGGTGDWVYLKGGTLGDWVFVHELGHVLDFRLGSTYLFNPMFFLPTPLMASIGPSAELLSHTGGRYNPNARCSDYAYADGSPGWGLCIGAGGAIGEVGYLAGGTPSGYGATNHFEDFADTWLAWVLTTTLTRYHNLPIPAVDAVRMNFMAVNARRFLETASR